MRFGTHATNRHSGRAAGALPDGAAQRRAQSPSPRAWLVGNGGLSVLRRHVLVIGPCCAHPPMHHSTDPDVPMLTTATRQQDTIPMPKRRLLLASLLLFVGLWLIGDTLLHTATAPGVPAYVVLRVAGPGVDLGIDAHPAQVAAPG